MLEILPASSAPARYENCCYGDGTIEAVKLNSLDRLPLELLANIAECLRCERGCDGLNHVKSFTLASRRTRVASQHILRAHIKVKSIEKSLCEMAESLAQMTSSTATWACSGNRIHSQLQYVPDGVL